MAQDKDRRRSRGQGISPSVSKGSVLLSQRASRKNIYYGGDILKFLPQAVVRTGVTFAVVAAIQRLGAGLVGGTWTTSGPR